MCETPEEFRNRCRPDHYEEEFGARVYPPYPGLDEYGVMVKAIEEVMPNPPEKTIEERVQELETQVERLNLRVVRLRYGPTRLRK